MTDAEHELVKENRELRERLAHSNELAQRAVAAAIEAQDAARGGHEPWLDDARRGLMPA